MINKVLHVCTECYPVAKAGGMADVVGSLPKYQLEYDWEPAVIIPKYKLPWFSKNESEVVYQSGFLMEGNEVGFKILKYDKTDLPFTLYAIDIPELYDRASIYLNEFGHGFSDEPERNVAFQRSVLDWLARSDERFDLIHCHDHQVGFIPFLIAEVQEFESIRDIPCFYTIHNGAYNSRYPWNRMDLLPSFKASERNKIDWDGHIDAATAALRYAGHINTVSPSYLEELKSFMPVLAYMSEQYPEKFSGTLNGIDEETWDPKTDSLIETNLKISVDKFKKENKSSILSDLYHINDIPLISFIGRFAHQKGGDLLVPSIEKILARFGFVNFYILGSGDKFLEHQVQHLRDRYSERVACYIGYNETLAHKIYAASDFIVMPSRFEPCGLNQMFGMRYGSLVIARKTGGLSDTVIDFEKGGLGISFKYDSVDDLTKAMSRALHLYKDRATFRKLRNRAMKKNFSWSKSAKEYTNIYNRLIK